MAKRKKAPAATYTYVPDPKSPSKTPKTGKTPARYKRTGGIKKVKTSAEKGRPLKNTVSPTRPRELIATELSGEEARDLGRESFAKSQAADFKDLSAARQTQLLDQIQALPAGGENVEGPTPRPSRMNVTPGTRPILAGRQMRGGVAPRGRAMGPLIPVSGNVLPSTTPASGTGASSAPAKPDADTSGGAMVVGKGAGAPDAISARRTGGKTVRSRKKVVKRVPDALAESVVVNKKVRVPNPGGTSGEIEVATVRQPTKKVEEVQTTSTYIPTASATNPDVREMRSEQDIKKSSRRARRRLPGGLRTTEYRPMDVAGRNTSGERKRKRAQAKLDRRIAKGKVKLRKGVVMGAAEAEAAAAENVAAKANISVSDLPNRNAAPFAYSDESMAQELARTHFKGSKKRGEGHTASEIMDYVKSTGSTMTAFHSHVMNAVKATKKKYDIKVGPPGDERTRSAGKITRWKVDPKSKTGFTEVSSYRGWQRKKSRNEQGANVKGWVKFDAPPTKGTISHLDYLHYQIQKWKENRALEAQDTREINRQRRQDRATAGLVDAMSGAAPTTGGKGPGRTMRNAGGKSITRPPKGRSGRYMRGKKNPETGSVTGATLITPEKPTFTEVTPNKKRLNYE